MTSVTTVAGDHCSLDLTQVPTTGMKLNHPFKAFDVEDSNTLRLVDDFDWVESLDQTAACVVTLRPVRKLKQWRWAEAGIRCNPEWHMCHAYNRTSHWIH
jgi:hypothetical protein